MATREVNNSLDVIRYEGEDLFRTVVGRNDVERRLAQPRGTTDFSRVGEQLQTLVEEFENSPQGRRAREIVNEINIRDLTASSLTEIGSQIFKNGINGCSLTVFYVFCKELMKRCWNAGVNLVRNIYIWTTDFIFDTICPWVADNGGWGKVLGMIAGALGLIALVGLFLFLL
ncbi:hypothetical protein X975_07195, partial [Stegodyphus mimosarum]